MIEGYRDLGIRAVSLSHVVGLTCHHCRVRWGGCAAECCCPECGAPKDYQGDGGCCCDACRGILRGAEEAERAMTEHTPGQPELGRSPTHPEGTRDAVHVAVVVAVAGCVLAPGARVSRSEDGRYRDLEHGDFDGKQVGIVDPYLKVPVRQGSAFWLCLFPGAVTSLRHHWTHPEFRGAGEPHPEPSGAVSV